MAPRIPEWYVTMLGMMKLGVIPMPATTLCTTHDIEYRLNRAEATIAITDIENAAKIEEHGRRAGIGGHGQRSIDGAR